MLKKQRNFFAKHIFKKFKLPYQKLTIIAKKRKPRVILEESLFKKEYQKKYFQRNSLIPEEQKKLHYKFPNFLVISKIIGQFITYHKFPGTKIRLVGFPYKSTNYF